MIDRPGSNVGRTATWADSAPAGPQLNALRRTGHVFGDGGKPSLVLSPDERGVALIELALVSTVLFSLLVGMFTGGAAYNKKLSVTHAMREGARYGAALPLYQTFSGTATWASTVQAVAVARSGNTLTSADVCVALVSGISPPVVVTPTVTGFSQSDFAQNGATASTSPCFDDGTSDPKPRVQVSGSTTAPLQYVFASQTVTLSSRGVAKFEACPSGLTATCP